jgi:hypothetical protein
MSRIVIVTFDHRIFVFDIVEPIQNVRSLKKSKAIPVTGCGGGL